MRQAVKYIILFLYTTNVPLISQELVNTTNYFKTATDEKTLFLDFEIDPYYTSLALVWNFGSNSIYDAGDENEQSVYWLLLQKSLIPGIALIEASLNPLPLAGALIKKYDEPLYDKLEIQPGFNVIESLTTGFNEPFAVSLFLGNIITFTDLSQFTQKQNKAYVGLLFNAGNYHIKSNKLIKDKWLETEWKIKGTREFDDSRLSWHLKMGTKLHENIEIKDTIYFSIIRGRLDFDSNWYSIFDSSGFEYRFDLDIKTLHFMRQLLILEKKWHLGKGHELSIKVGFQWIGREAYTGSLTSSTPSDEWSFLFYPGFVF